MTKKQYIISTLVLILTGLILCIEIIIDCRRDGDFIGYIHCGNLVLAHKDIYSDWLNTWPPFFSLFCVPLALGDRVSSILIRLLWLTGNLAAMYFITKLTIKMALNKPLVLNRKIDGIRLQDTRIIIPLLIILRFLLENLANLQLNIVMLLLATLAIYYFIQNKYYVSGFLLAMSISLKVYTVFLLFYFIYKREWKIALNTFLFFLLINSICFFVFGFDKAIFNYVHWFKTIASNPPTAIHLNQSVSGLIARLITSADPENNFYINFLSLNHPVDTCVKYGIILLGAIYPAYIFRNKLTQKDNAKAILEYSVIFSIIPLVSTLSWKAYFIFLWLPYFVTFIYLFNTPSHIKPNKLKTLKALFFASVILNVFTSDGIIGKRLSDILQSFSCVTIGTIILVIIQLVIYVNMDKFKEAFISPSMSKV